MRNSVYLQLFPKNNSDKLYSVKKSTFTTEAIAHITMPGDCADASHGRPRIAGGGQNYVIDIKFFGSNGYKKGGPIFKRLCGVGDPFSVRMRD
jgi:hypothetical protein